MKNCKTRTEALCETDERNEKIFTSDQLDQSSIEITQRILEAFYFAADREIAFLLKTDVGDIRDFTERGQLPSTEILLLINKVTGVSLDWLLTGKGTKYPTANRPQLLLPKPRYNSLASTQTF